jgi:Protein of unknown function (DUF3574)
MRSFWLLGAGALALFTVTTPASAQGITCSDPQKPMLVIDLMFGRDIGGALGVTEEQWSDFVAREISPRFPEGLSVDDALGQWRDRDTGAIVKEPSKDVTLIVAQDADVKGKIDAIVSAYKERFKQQSVGVVMRPACVSF